MNFNKIYEKAELLRKGPLHEEVEATAKRRYKPYWTDAYYCDVFADTLKNAETGEHDFQNPTTNFGSATSFFNKELQKFLDRYIDKAFEEVANGSEWFGDILDVQAKADIKNGRVIFKYLSAEGVDPDSCLRFTQELIDYLSEENFSIRPDWEAELEEGEIEEGDFIGFAFEKAHGAYTYASTPDGYETERTYL